MVTGKPLTANRILIPIEPSSGTGESPFTCNFAYTKGPFIELGPWESVLSKRATPRESGYKGPDRVFRGRGFLRQLNGARGRGLVMKHLIRLFVSLLVPALMLAFATATPAMKHEMAKEKAKEVKATNTTKVLHDDDRVRVLENTTKPGENNANVVRGKRVVRYLQGGTTERTYADGRKETVERKTGEVRVAGPDKEAYWAKNIGKTTIVSYVVQIKEAKK